MTTTQDRSGACKRSKARRGFLAEMAAAVLALPLLPWSRRASAQAVYYDQYGQPVTIAPGSVVTPAAPAAAVPPAPGYGAYGPAGVVGQTRSVARRTSRRTGRREDTREDLRDELDD
jgi:hypothetical protein